MDSSNLILAILLSGLFLSFSGTTNSVPVQTLIDNACKQSIDYKSCLVILQQNSETSSATDALSLAKIALKAVIKQSSIIVAFLSPTIKSYPKAAKPLGQCIDIFQSSEKELNIPDGEWKDGLATMDVEDVLDSVGICEGLLQGSKINIPALGVMITKWKTLLHPAYGAAAAVESPHGIKDINI